MSEPRTFTADEVSDIVRKRLASVRTPAALLDLCMEALRRCDELEARINKLEMKR